MDQITAWYETYRYQLCQIAQHMGYSKEDSNDFVQQFFLEILQKNISASIHNPHAFLALAFKRKIIDFYRTAKRIEKRKAAAPDTALLLAQDELNEETFDLLSKVEEAYKKIPARCRRIIYLKYYKGLTNEEIVNETGLSLQTVYNNLCKGIQLLRRELNSNIPGLKISSFFLLLGLLEQMPQKIYSNY